MVQVLGVTDDDLTRRAFGAYFRSGGFDQPSNGSGVEWHNDKAYVVLGNINGILAVYRVQMSGALKRLRRWPAAIQANWG